MDLRKFLFSILMVLTWPTQATESVWLYNVTDQHTEFERNVDQVRPIASITKIMTALVALEHDTNLQRTLAMSGRVGSYLPRKKYSRYELLMAMLVRSDNAAAETFAEDYPGGRRAFVTAMNNTAKKLNLHSMRFDDPSGLSSKNTATARDVGTMMQIAAQHWLIRHISVKQQIDVDASTGKKVTYIHLVNTNQPVLFEFGNIVVSKTGLTSPAGWCMGLVAEQSQKQYVIVILGSRTKKERQTTVQSIMYNHVVNQNLQHVTITR
jgi:D-alanyl-D-alanine endopeptidase (penicillin-binding protein 7)